MPQEKDGKPDSKSGVFSLWTQFKEFAFKGNVVDLAVGVIVGAAFGKIVDSLVKHIIMPLISTVIPGEESYRDWSVVINEKEIPYGLFIGEVVNFLLVSLVLFIFVVKFLGWLARTRRERDEAGKDSTPPPLTRDQELLTEIRDLLKRDRPDAGTATPGVI